MDFDVEVDFEKICPWCGELADLGLLDFWGPERAFLLDSCCERAHEEALFAFGTEDWQAFFAEHAGLRIRSLFEDCESLRIDFGLRLVPVDLQPPQSSSIATTGITAGRLAGAGAMGSPTETTSSASPWSAGRSRMPSTRPVSSR